VSLSLFLAGMISCSHVWFWNSVLGIVEHMLASSRGSRCIGFVKYLQIFEIANGQSTGLRLGFWNRVFISTPDCKHT
jgi:hypothetical protein